jgi:peptidoglycan/LPS O-acetylase OafA/YrhL
VAGSLAACLVTLSLSNAPIDIYMLPTSWSSALVIGAAAQLHKERLAPLAERGWPLAVLLLTAMCFLPDAKSHSYTYLIGAPLIGVCASALVLKAARWEEIWVWSTPLRWLGLISYAAYLWDFPIINWLRGSEANKLPLWGGPASIVLTIAAATASWYMLERHALRLKDRLNIGRRRGRHAAGIPVIKVPAGVT